MNKYNLIYAAGFLPVGLFPPSGIVLDNPDVLQSFNDGFG